MALRLTAARCVLLFHVMRIIVDGGKSAKDNQDVPVMVGGTWNLSSQRRQQMSKKWFKCLKRWSEWKKLCRKYDAMLTVLFDNVMSQAYEHKTQEANDD